MTVFGLQTAALSSVRIGLVGLGERGVQALKRLCQIDGACVTAICDISNERIRDVLDAQYIYRFSPFPSAFSNYQHLCRANNVDLVYICTDWLTHVPIIIEALQHGKHVAVEVPAATTIDDIHAIVDAAEQTQRHCMMLENCVYDHFEMAVLNMVKQGLLGEIVHVEGGYAHQLGDKWPTWRLEYNKDTRGDVYPTHGMGPACQLLDIHRSDYLDTLVSMDSSSFEGTNTYQKMTGKNTPYFNNGDQTTTIIRTAKGKTILLQHNVMTPRPYSRMFQVVGTKGYAEKYPISNIICESSLVNKDDLPTDPSAFILDTPYRKYLPEYVEPLINIGKALDGRGGMAYYMDWRLIYCLRNGLPLDMDVYDLAEWCAVSELSRRSIEQGFVPVKFPTFHK